MNSNVKWLLTPAIAVSLTVFPALAQDPAQSAPPQSGGWKRFQQNTPPDGSAPFDPNQAPAQAVPVPPAPMGIGRITIPAGTWLTIRVNEPLSSDHNQEGDAFIGTLVQSIVVNGIVVAHRGQTVTGRVTEAKKAGRVSGVSRLGLELTELTLADGNRIQLRTSMMQRQGDTSHGRDAAAIAATTGTGAAIGAAADGGFGAGIGAAAGAVASTIGVLLTRGTPTVVFPETALSCRLEVPVTFEANSAAFQAPSPQEYSSNGPQRRPAPSRPYGPPPPPPPYGYYPRPYYYAYPYPYPYWGPTFYFSYRGGHRW